MPTTAAYFPAVTPSALFGTVRYHNTAYAIAELIDNSVEADAEQIELLCMEEIQPVRERMRPRSF